jgi:NAD(P)-dependent dehydrogenase (short-subunit alcohol dehydrogenase family)
MSGKSALITGGTKGIGLASALEFGKAGAQVYLTYKWGSADSNEIEELFKSVKAKKPILIQADVSMEEDTDSLIEEIKKTADYIDIFINNVGFALRTDSLKDYKKRSLFKTLEYSTWPLISYTMKLNEVFGRFPGYIVGISSNGPDHYYRGYDFVAASKALMEFFARYLSVHLDKEGSRVNVVRFGNVKTESFTAIFGEDFFTHLEEVEGVDKNRILTPEECGKTVFALCSGYLDSVNGQIINADKGLPFQDNAMMRYMKSLDK